MLSVREMADDAETAANLIEDHGWFRIDAEKGAVRFPVGGSEKTYCAITAFPGPNCLALEDEFAKFLGWSYTLHGICADEFIMAWNDRHAEPSPVINTLRTFASYLREKD